MILKNEINSTKTAKNEVAIFWLGQAGFVIKDTLGRTIYLDPYLTDCCERLYGFKRFTPKLIAPNEVETDILVTSHHHEDHYDIDAVYEILSFHKTRLIGSKSAAQKCLDMGIAKEKIIEMEAGDNVIIDNISFKAVYADHGDLAPDAIGMLIEIDGIKIYFSGDTAYRPENMKDAIAFKPDIAILPINGAYGNLNAEEAAKLTGDLKAKVVIPCHFWTFKEHGGNPQDFEESMKKYSPECITKFMYQGEVFIYKAL